jgi:hypothetical protein
VAEEITRPSLLHSLPKAVGETGQKPAQAPVVGYPAPTELPIHKPIQLNLERPGSNGKNHSDEPEEDDDHPSVDKLFADIIAPPPTTPSRYRNNGHS